MSEKVIVKFTKPWRGYSPGEIAGFEEDAAGALVAGGVASRYSPASSAAPVTSPLVAGRAKSAGRKAGGQSGASKPPVAGAQSPDEEPTSVEGTQPLSPAGVGGGADPHAGADVVPENVGGSDPDQGNGNGDESDTPPGVVDEDDDDGKP
ncbi:hypothetical protein BLX42_11275 [Pseudomonas sp. SG-MS2]|uniref:hypothetical protein n=1 Tax=Pseudomonas sp. SG-MS2 TaxID=1914534 RepID=UPI001379B689|nr:hypothetical protein [Pseudomonas sp. SG-MS2]KAF1310957.1 hypothetical protein BLX42_11275 [Pseudomonas sp. SG-MS2]